MKRSQKILVITVAISVALVCVTAKSSQADEALDDLRFAGGQTVVVVPFVGKSLDGTAEARSTEQRRLTQAVVQGASAAGHIAELAGLNMVDILVLGGCKSTDVDCLSGLPTALGADVIVFGNLKRDGTKTIVGLLVIAEGKRLIREQIVLSDLDIDSRELELEAAVGRFFRDEPTAEPKDVADRSSSKGSPNSISSGDANGVGENALEDRTNLDVVDGETSTDSGAIEAREAPVSQGEKPTETVVSSSASSATSSSGFDFGRVRRSYWTVGAVGLGAVATGSIFLALGSSKQSEINAHPTQSTADLENLKSLEGQANTLFTVGNVLLIGGVVTAAVAGALIFKEARPRVQRAREAELALDIVPAVFPGGAGVVATIRGWQ